MAKTAAAANPAKELVTKTDSQELARQDNALFAAHAGAGLENVTARDILIPRITILQPLSPQVVKGKAEFNPDARPGMIFDVGMAEIIGDGNSMLFLPVLYNKVWVEWYPRNTGKGLAAIHTSEDVMDRTQRDDKNKPILPNGNYIAETAQFYGLNLTSNNRLSFLPMTSTQLKKARQWNTFATGEKVQGPDGEFTPPLFYRAYTLTTVPESNAEGDWMGWKIERGPRLQDMEGWQGTFERLVEYHKQISSGQAKGDVAGIEDEVAASVTSADENRAM